MSFGSTFRKVDKPFRKTVHYSAKASPYVFMGVAAGASALAGPEAGLPILEAGVPVTAALTSSDKMLNN